MAISSGVFSTAFLSPETASPFLRSSPVSRLAAPPVTLRMVRTVTFATASKPVTGKREPRGIMKPRPVSPEMAALVGAPEIPRTQALKQIWAYIKEHNLQGFGCCLCVLIWVGAMFVVKALLVYMMLAIAFSLVLDVSASHKEKASMVSVVNDDPENKKVIICDEKLKKIFAGKDRVGFLEIAGLISPHFL
ncbi:hypothetical protein EZV62_011163 [Acer yangbiense]|uniref:SWIB domain-containing protein n=1 Tax=Acer yangbiense TaxID=1000413 RepID=A0A5C7I5P5_9ROSI|nr:hypothetical protein EZV62_011163 [Acer yangbiense]